MTPKVQKTIGIVLTVIGLLGLGGLITILTTPSGRAALYQKETPARVYGTSGMLVFTGEIRSSQGDYVQVCKWNYMPSFNLGCMVVKVGGPFVVVAGEISRDGGLK